LERKKSEGTKLSVFEGRSARSNRAIFEALAKESPQTIKQLYKQVRIQKGLEETYYASLTKRLHCLRETGYITQTPAQGDSRVQVYELRMKAYLASLLNMYSMQEIIDQATDTQASYILLALLNALIPEK